MGDILQRELEQIPARVGRGMEWMAETYPGFKPDKQRLDISSCKLCVMGQAAAPTKNCYGDGVPGSFWTELRRLEITFEQAVELGLATPECLPHDGYDDALTEEWLRRLPG